MIGIRGDGINAVFEEFDTPASVFVGFQEWLLTILTQTYLLAVVIILLSVSTGQSYDDDD